MGVLKGGMPAWRAAGLPVTATAPVDPVAAIPEARARGYTLLDVRTVDEFSCADNGHVRDAVNVPAASLPFVLEELDKTLRYVVYCGCVRVSRRARVRLCVFVLACARLYECVRTVCRSGFRSTIATSFMQRHGFDVQEMGGYVTRKFWCAHARGAVQCNARARAWRAVLRRLLRSTVPAECTGRKAAAVLAGTATA